MGSVLAPSGRILLLVSSLTGISEVRDLFEKRLFMVEILRQEIVEDEILYVLPDYPGRWLIFFNKKYEDIFDGQELVSLNLYRLN